MCFSHSHTLSLVLATSFQPLSQKGQVEEAGLAWGVTPSLCFWEWDLRPWSQMWEAQLWGCRFPPTLQHVQAAHQQTGGSWGMQGSWWRWEIPVSFGICVMNLCDEKYTLFLYILLYFHIFLSFFLPEDWLCLVHHHSKILSGWWDISRYNVTCCSSFSTQMTSNVGRIKKIFFFFNSNNLTCFSVCFKDVFTNGVWELFCSDWVGAGKWCQQLNFERHLRKTKGVIGQASKEEPAVRKVWVGESLKAMQVFHCAVQESRIWMWQDCWEKKKMKTQPSQDSGQNAGFRITRGKKGQDETKGGRRCLPFLSE